MQKKLVLAIIALVTICGFAISLASPAIASWIDNSIVSITTSAATTGITTEVVGVATNANINPIDINGHTYSAPGGDGAYSITQFDSGPIVSDPTTLISTASISASGWVPGDYALFKVTITNNGPTTLQFSDPYTIVNYFTSPGSSYTFPTQTFPLPVGTIGGNTVPVGTAPTVVGPANNAGPGWQYSNINYGWTSEATTAAMTADFNIAITTDTYGLINTWGANNYLIGSAPTVGQTLATSGTFVYYIAIGLGVDTAPGIPNAVYTVTIPLTVAN